MTTQFNARFNVNTLVMALCTAIILGALTWVGRTTGNTHDSVIVLQTKQEAVEANVAAIKQTMLTRADLSIELLKLQIPASKAATIAPEVKEK